MKRRSGFVALTSVLVLSAIFLSISISISSRTISGTNNSLALQSGYHAETLANLCAEYALMELRRTLNYSGNDSILINGDSCDILTISGSGNNDRIVKTVSTTSPYSHRTEVIVSQISPITIISSWNEVADF